uniref:INCENP_ARK-bind domain-containing protein n=1 Tax=Syphacia muris TaxID=451379 RepID=A0A0N5AIZ8_9BILA
MKPDSTGQRYGSTTENWSEYYLINVNLQLEIRYDDYIKTDKQENTKENSTAITSDALVAQKYYDKKASTEIEHAEATELECIGQMKLTADGDGTKTGICSQTVGELYGLSLSDKQDQVPEPMDSDSSMPSENSSVACKPSDEDNYDIADLSSEDTTDSEDSPKKKIPTWASFRCLDRELRKQSLLPLSYVDKIFGEVEAPDLNVIFSGDRIYCTKRTSSAVWASPLSNPRQGISIYDSVQKQS